MSEFVWALTKMGHDDWGTPTVASVEVFRDLGNAMLAHPELSWSTTREKGASIEVHEHRGADWRLDRVPIR